MASRPRLLLITPDFPPARGGIQVLAHRLAAGIEGFETIVVTSGQRGGDQFDREAGLDVRRVPAPRGPGAVRNVLLDAAALELALRVRPRVTLSMHIASSPAAAGVRRVLAAPVAQYFHAEEIGARPRLAAFAARHADEVIAVSRYTEGLIAATGAVPARMSLIPGGVDIPRDPTPLAVDRPTFLTIARLGERYKGHDVMIRAMPLVLARVPDAQWVVIGDGPLRPGLQQLARAYGVADSIRFLGSLPDEDRDLWLRRTRLLAMPSRLPAGRFAGEGFGIAYIEAGAYGKPVLAGNVAGAPDAVIDGESGLLVDPADPVAVADGITRLLLDADLAARLGEGGARRARSQAWPLVCERVEGVLRGLLR